ncbi:lipopolysaccharide O-acetyltransferase [Buttiauxella sp. JUb87]|uniref:DapH/DapD/GlmU-related protein n=1 Tax=Buttiauxella sp. JUb87 TaxID=2485129 RepID=UPI00106135A6|nr:DapH/DapD/GlmU-related protein [Buttiauxella sp. JUb87]TDN55098.1 lipopolysaccharide O-acetyltransferase [Buttiauxella sp. JUb87]
MLRFFFWFIVNAPTQFRNKILNLLYFLCYTKKINVDWRSVKIINPKQIVIGKKFSAGQGLWLQAISDDSKLEIGDDVNISDWSHIGALNKVVISSGCLIGSKVHITDHSHGSTFFLDELMPNRRKLVSKGEVFVGKNVWIGDGAIILPGVNIGEGAIIGANSVVTKSIPEYSIAAGNPAEVIRFLR